MPVLAVARAVRGVRQDDELAVAVRKLACRSPAGPRRSSCRPRSPRIISTGDEHLVRIDDRQVRRHVEIGAGRDVIAELHLHGDDRLRHRRVVCRGWPSRVKIERIMAASRLRRGVGAQLVERSSAAARSRPRLRPCR